MRRDCSPAGGGLVRLLACVLSAAGVIWGGYCFPVTVHQSAVNAAAKRIAAGDSFKRDALDDVVFKAAEIPTSKWMHPSSLASAAIIYTRLLERAVGDADQSAVDRVQGLLRTTVERALSSAPADPYLWLILFWLQNAQNGFRVDNLKYLAMSYAIGPSEGWVALKRSPLALALFDALTPDLQKGAISEFAGLVNSGFVSEAAYILTGPGWPVRDRLLPQLAGVDAAYRDQFAKAVYRLGYNALVPGVEPFGFRPWR